MGRPQKMKNLVGIFKDKVSLIKATLLFSSKPTTSFHIAVLRATTHRHPSDPPPLDAVLSLVNHYRPSTSGVLIHALLQRLHGTTSVYVALKCLLTLHHVIIHGSPALKEEILGYSTGPLLNLSGFKDDSGGDTWELSEWVRWYGDVIDHGVGLSRRKNRGGGERLGLLINMVEVICGAPESLHYQRISLIYEVIKLVGEDYRMIMREINALINQFGKKRIQDLSNDSIGELLNDLKRLQNCREKLVLMFLNKKNDGVWELIEEVRKDVEEVKERRENMKLLKLERSESTRVAENRVGELISVSVVPPRRNRRWLDVEWNTMVASYG
ncbi:putative clathrin assembly protein At4g40080 [Chenopodium quinoa]|uniref:ENTH domain-containing protein n=1 Tax=Chenopodium quinoa TaxID=63459 RepID=A0A803MED8_CHEQI|nr:putative clathrin assembly protein At4g40080 [Chenopodium quinoa]